MTLFKRESLKNIPINPGIYHMKDVQGFVLYVGKAKNLKKRVSSYFLTKNHDLKTRMLVSQIAEIDVIVTKTEAEALILENQVIKQYKPKYNILLKDDKTYPYVKLTNEVFPKIIVTRKKLKDNDYYFGPYPAIGSAKGLQRLLYDLFPLRDCKQKISRDKVEPKCILVDINKCLGPCIYKDINGEYDRLVQELKWLLSGKNKELLKSLNIQMKNFSNKLEFESAGRIRDRIQKIEQLGIRQSVDLNLNTNVQVWAMSETDDYVYVMVQEIIKGKLLFQHGFYQNKKDINALSDFIDRIVIDIVVLQQEAPRLLFCSSSLKETLSEKTGLSCPQRGKKRAVVETAEKNAKLALLRLIKTENESVRDDDVVADMQAVLKLKKRPTTIIGFDISHLQGTHIVASAVMFKDGKPYKAGYRKFNIKSVEGKSNDPESMREVVFRRLRLCEKDGEPYPDLLLIDGGRAQLNYSLSALSKKGVLGDMEIISLAKREEEIYTPHEKDTIRLPKHSRVLHLLQHVRDESHRFALKFQRSKRKIS